MVRMNQRYISKELTHFVGAKLRKSVPNYESEQYALLIKILNSGTLTHSSPMKVGMSIKGNENISENEMYTPFMVCFCDIPIGDLSIHINKYSRFGLSFSKDFIANQGGLPVFYVPKEAKVPSPRNYPSKSECFDYMTKYYRLFFDILLSETPRESFGHKLPPFDPHNSHAPHTLNDILNKFPAVIYDLHNFFDYNVFSYCKFFDHKLSDEHPDNFYFEREWRVIGEVKFDIEHVMRILLPEEYAKQFRHDCPNYYGQITFVE